MCCRQADVALAAVASNNIITMNKVSNTVAVAKCEYVVILLVVTCFG